MVITVNSGNGNLANYLINGSSNNRNKEKITILEGNAHITDALSKSLDYEDSHFHFVLSANGKRSNEDMKDIYKVFRKELTHAYSDNEVNIFAVLHQDTDNSHIHLQVPKKNLLTDTKLDLYYHKRDMKRFEMIRDYLNKKYNEPPSKPNSKSNPTKNWSYNPEAVKNKFEKEKFKNKFLDYLFENKEQFNSLNDLLQHIQDDMNIQVSKLGYDYKKDDFYITIKHQERLKAQRIFSPMFNDGKSKYITDENGEKQYIKYDFKDAPIEKQKQYRQQESLQHLSERLDAMQSVHVKRVEARLTNNRQKAKERLIETVEPLQPIEPRDDTPSKSFPQDMIDKESLIKNSSQIYQTIEQFRKINLVEIATKLFRYREIDKGEFHTLIEHPKTAQRLLVYNDKEKQEYRFIDLNSPNRTGEIGKLLQMNIYSIHAEAIQLLNPIRMMFNIYKDLKKIGKSGLNLLVNHYQQKQFGDIDDDETPSIFSKLRNTPSPSKDLKPY